MSRLDSAIRRLTAQRACLEHAAALVAELAGPILELGLGNGRTYDHLREMLPDREIFVFERKVAAHPDCVPDDSRLLLGDFLETLPRALARIGRPAALAHADIGTGDRDRNARLAAAIGRPLKALMAPDGVVLCDQDLGDSVGSAVALPDHVAAGRYFIYRCPKSR